MSTVSVAIIGAGSAGIVQLKQLLDGFARPNVEKKLEVVVFESKHEVGGVWLSDGQTKPIRSAVLPVEGETRDSEQMYFYPPEGADPSPMYEGLHTNLPYDLMSYRDFPMAKHPELFPDRARIQQYLEEYSTHFNLRPHIRFNTRVKRLYHTPSTSSPSSSPTSRKWTIESIHLNTHDQKSEVFDYVCVANGHYADGWIPPIPGLAGFRGEIIHSRYYLKAEDYIGKTVLVVGSFASGGDISRQLGGLNIGKYTPEGQPINGHLHCGNGSTLGGFTKVYISASAPTLHSVDPNDSTSPWAKYVEYRTLISHVSPPSPESGSNSHGSIHLQDGSTLSNIDIIIFATGYNFMLPFCKITDSPWREIRLLDHVIQSGERDGGMEDEVGGMKGHTMHELDELMLFIKGDEERSIAFPVLQYQVVPFPLAETQTRFISLIWAGLLPNLPKEFSPPANPSNPYSTQINNNSHPFNSATTKQVNGNITNGSSTPHIAFLEDESRSTTPKTSLSLSSNGNDHDNGDTENAKKIIPKTSKERKVLAMRQKLVFGAPYEFMYQQYLMDLMSFADEGVDGIEEYWKKIEGWRMDRRADTGLRKRTIGY